MSNADQVDRSAQTPADQTDPTDGTANPSKSQGISKTEAKALKVGGAPMDEFQRVNANIIVGQAGQDHAGPKATKAMVVAAIGESKIRVIKNPKTVYSGVLQADPKNIPMEETATQAHYFLKGGLGFQGGGAIALAKEHPSWSPGHIAFVVEGDVSNFPDETAAARFYDICPPHANYNGGEEADAIIEAYGGVADPSESDSSSTVAVSYEFARGTVDHQDENSWDAAQRLAGDVEGWDLFAVSNRIYFFSEYKLIRQQPILTIARTDPRVISLRGTLDNTGTATTATLELLCGPFDYHAGEVFRITHAGPFSTGQWNGRWIVEDTSRSRTAATTTFTLKLPTRKGLEPAHDTKDGAAAASAPATDATVGSKLLTTAQLSGHPKPLDNVSQVAATIITRFPKLVVTCTTDHSTLTTGGNVSLHGSGQAIDLAAAGVSDSAGYMRDAAKWISDNLAQVLEEGIHNYGLSVDGGGIVPVTFWGAETWAQHANHIHIAVLESAVLTEG